MPQNWPSLFALLCALPLVVSAHAQAPSPGTIGLAIVSLKTAGVETPYLDECPEGVAIGNDEIWWKSLSPRDRDRLTDGGEKEPSARRTLATLRGPRGEDVCWNPTVVRDPPQRTVKGAQSLGFDIDGDNTGARTAKTCTHENFTSPDGKAGIDNQMRRVVGCIHGWRADGYIEMTSDTERRNSSQGVILIQISGVESLENSPDVTVRFFRAADVMPKDVSGNIIPFASYRIDGNPRYGAVARGRIRNSVLTTDPIDVRLPFFGNRVETEFFIRDLRLELTLTETGAKGLIGGYHDLANWWDYVRKMGYLIETAQFSCPALHEAATRLADGYPDPVTGACTALSVAYAVDAVRGFVNETPKPVAPPRIAGLGPIDPAALPPGLKIGTVAGGEVLTSKDGKSLYAMGGAACDGDCAAGFAPLAAAWGAGPRGDWTPATGPDGTRQWTLAGRAIFTCVGDHLPGDANCIRDGWLPLTLKDSPPLPAALTIQPSEMGPIVADRDGRTLYKLIGQLPDFMREICDKACMDKQWRLAIAGDGAAAAGSFSITDIDGTPVWAFRDRPLYTFAGDEGPSHIAGHRFGGASVSAKNWFSVITAAEATGPAPELKFQEETR